MTHAQIAMAVTGAVLGLLAILWAIWVADESRGYDYRAWHRPAAIGLFIASGAAFIASVWMGV